MMNDITAKAWITEQIENYKSNKKEMRNPEIRKKFEEFMAEHSLSEFLLTPEELWKNNLKKLENYIETNKKLPSTKDKDPEVRELAKWMNKQNKDYKAVSKKI